MKCFVPLCLCGLASVSLMTGCHSLPPGTTGLTLVRDSVPAATIVLAQNPTRAARFAAAELQEHLRLITGATLPVASDDAGTTGTLILVGASKAAVALGCNALDLKSQEYLIQFRSAAVVLLGRDKDDRGPFDYQNPQTFPDLDDEQGTNYAVYNFLEKFCGVRWYLPSDLGTVYPTTPTLRVTGRDLRRAPVMKWRGQSTAYQFPADLHGDTIRGKEPTPVLPWREQQLWWHRQRIGGEPYSANHSFYGYYDRFLKEHPDWFAQGHEGKPPQLCYSNPELIKQVVQDARDFFDGKGLKPGAVGAGDVFALVPMDNNSWCQCPRCRPLWPDQPVRGKGQFSNDRASDYVFGFMNAVAREIQKSHPGKRLATIAYADYAFPPLRERLAPNVSVQMCLHARNIEAKSTQENDRRLLQSWVDESRERPKYLWLYYCFPSLVATQQQFRCFPAFFAHTVVKEMQWYHDSGVRGLYFEPSYLADERRSPLLDQLEAYVTWKLADDQTLDGNGVIDEFFRLYYGPAAVPMKAFYERVEAIYANPANYPKDWKNHQTEQAAWSFLGTAEHMAELGRFMAQAKVAVQTGNEIEKQRVALFEKGIWQYMLAGRATYVRNCGKMAETLQQARVPRLTGTVPGGDPAKVDWTAAGVLSGWRQMRGDTTPRKVSARLLHDGQFLYLLLEEQMDPKKLVLKDDNIWGEDEWEIFFGKQRDRPYRQMGVNARGVHADLCWGEATEKWDSGAKVVADTAAPDRWQTKIALPLAKLLPGGVKPGDKIYFNIIRSTGTDATAALAWIPTFAGYHEPGRFGDVTLEP